MTTAEFIAWFEGFTKRIKGKPSHKEWDEIVAKIAAVDDRSPLKAWFEGLRVKVTKAPGDREWGEIKKHVAEEGARGGAKQNRMQDLFQSFEEKSSAMREVPGAKARGAAQKKKGRE